MEYNSIKKMNMNQCRVCLNQEGDMVNIFQTDDDLMISTKIMCLAKVRIYQGDGLPNLICTACITKLNNCIEFIHLCEVSDLKLRIPHPTENEEVSTSEINHDNTSHEVISENGSIKAESTEDSQVNNNVNTILNDNIGNTSNGKERRKEIKKKQQCNICGRVMSSRHRLNTHLVTHTGERPFTCPLCPKKFSLEANLKVHLRVHTGEKPYKCGVCGKAFAHSSGLITHKRKHTGKMPYRCTMCPRKFRTTGHLEYHLRVHTGEKNYECELCLRAFITRSDLKQHLTTHSGDRPHVCSMCGVRFSRASNLVRHMRQIHSDKNHGDAGSESALIKIEKERN